MEYSSHIATAQPAPPPITEWTCGACNYENTRIEDEKTCRSCGNLRSAQNPDQYPLDPLLLDDDEELLE